VAQDTFYVGTLKGVGRVYQQTAIDTYSKVAFAKLYDRKTPLTSADLMNDRVVPFFEENEIVVSRVLTDRGTEFCGKPEHHEYELYLAIENIDHTRTKARSPQTNGICERFHKTPARCRGTEDRWPIQSLLAIVIMHHVTLPTSSFFFVSTEMTGSPFACAAHHAPRPSPKSVRRAGGAPAQTAVPAWFTQNLLHAPGNGLELGHLPHEVKRARAHLTPAERDTKNFALVRRRLTRSQMSSDA
jgi:transposase InsO family protein